MKGIVLRVIDPRGFPVVLTERALEHILEDHREFTLKADEYIRAAAERPKLITTNIRYPNQERYRGPAIATGFTSGDTPVFAANIRPDNTRMIVTAWTTSNLVPGETQIWPPPSGGKKHGS